MAHLPINILGIDASNKLILSDRRKTIVNSKSTLRKIRWKTNTSRSGVKSFRIVGKTSYNPFESSIPIVFDDKVELIVRKDENIEWSYTIEWKKKTMMSLLQMTLSFQSNHLQNIRKMAF